MESVGAVSQEPGGLVPYLRVQAVIPVGGELGGMITENHAELTLDAVQIFKELTGLHAEFIQKAESHIS
jgi:hypothetical protein